MKIFHAVLIASVVLVSSNEAFARYTTTKGPCATDANRFCGGGVLTTGAAPKCLMDHKDQLSASCKARLFKHKK
ncbi:MAG: hypothetical protein J0I79_25925 [Mesorhizobium sp.]|uniref:hypothetical protein n=1 Tax=Mesorhizobium sp. TaxID=1871066 RepID=UPI001AC80EA3|nr:hypothetical protein [Mesorhizobium sp.]MBN9221395.1 hypothetical protein [Mesorhizobium sp.]